MFLICDEEIVSLSNKVYVFSDSVVYLGMMNENSQSNTVWENKLTCIKSSPQDRILDTIDSESMEFECNIFQGSQFCNKVQEFLSKMSEEPEELKRRIIFISMFNDIS